MENRNTKNTSLGTSSQKKPVSKPASSTTKQSASSTSTKRTTSNASTKTSATSSSAKSTASSNSSKPLKKKSNSKTLKIVIPIIAILVVVALVVGIVLATRKPGDKNNPPDTPPVENTIPTPSTGVYVPSGDLKPVDPYAEVKLGEETYYKESEIKDFTYDTNVSSTTAVGFYSQQIGEVDRAVPETTRDEGLGVYPKFGYTLNTVIGSSEQNLAHRNALIQEANYLCANGTFNNSGNGGGYVWMDKDGYLYNGTTANPIPALDKLEKHRRLYKHSASAGLYFGDVAEDEPGIIKKVTLRPRGYNSYSVTGVYAPAGEIIKIQISEADMNATGGLTIHIGQALYNGQANNIWTAKGQMQRFPIILNTMVVNKNTATLENGVYTAYVGSFLGGPLYIRNTKATFTATISGGVAYSHFILGYTTKEEFDANKNTSAPYFDLEVWNYGVLHSGPKIYAKNFSYEDIYKAAILWEKVSSVTTTGSSQGIVFLYEPFVAAGAAVAFPGRSSVNCPGGWMSSSLNYNSMVTSGAWGNFHEYHHNFQGYGVGNGGEVTNNGMTLVSYALFTKISSSRSITNYGAGPLGGWNAYTSATWALNDLLKISRGGSPSNGKQGLAIYATLLHNFGPDDYIQSKIKQQKSGYGQTYSGYLRAWQDITHNDMTYFFKDVLQGITEEVASKWKNPEYPTFVPVSSVYQTGRSYNYDGEKRYFKTMQPYIIPYGKDFNIDLSPYTAPNGQYASGSIVIPDDFTYTIKRVGTPDSGTIEKIDDYNYKFKPGSDLNSGKIIVTLSVTHKQNAFKVDDIDLVLEFEQSHETNKTTLTRTTYSYTAESMYTDAEEAYKSNYAEYNDKTEMDHNNPTQNCNTDIWYYPDDETNHNKYPNAPAHHFIKDNTIAEVRGKLYFNDAGKYRIYLRGRQNCAVYYSVDGGVNYTLGAAVKNGSGAAFYPNDPNSYFDIEVEEDSWIYFKSVLIVKTAARSYIGLGTAKWTEPMFTIVNKYYDAEGNEVANEEDAVRIETHYYDYRGNEVTEEEANRAELIPPTSATYVNAYREDYEFPSNAGFESDYFYTRGYTFSYNESEKIMSATQSYVESETNNYKPWDNTAVHAITNLFDNNDNTFIHSNREAISDSNPFSVTVKLSETVTANRLTFHGSQTNGGRYATYMPKNFQVWVSENGEDWTLVCTQTNTSYNNNYKVVAVFDSMYSFNYYRVAVTATHARNNLGYICLNKIELSSIFSLTNGKLYSPDNEMFTYSNGWSGVQTYSTFGHIYVGKNNSTITFNFTGTRLALISNSAYGKNFEVTIDGHIVSSIALEETNLPYAASYISSLLESGSHTVNIKCKGNASIDSIAVF